MVLGRLFTLAGVVAVHAGLLLWIATYPIKNPPRLVVPSIQGVLIDAEPEAAPATSTVEPPPPHPKQEPPRPKARPQEPTPAPEPQPDPEPKTTPATSTVAPVLPPPEPEPPRPKPKPPKPAPAPEPKPPSLQEKATAVPKPAPAVAPTTEPQPEEPASVTRVSKAPATAVPASRPAPLVPPRTDAAHLNNPDPPYPSLSRRLGENGRVLLDVHILPDGSVGEIRLRQSSGYPRLDQAALDTVRRWRYVPARRGDEPIAFWYVQPIMFALNR